MYDDCPVCGKKGVYVKATQHGEGDIYKCRRCKAYRWACENTWFDDEGKPKVHVGSVLTIHLGNERTVASETQADRPEEV